MTARTDLSGLRVIVTRPEKQAERWCAQLRELGANGVMVSVMALEAVSDVQQRQAIKQLVMEFDLFQKAIFVSQNAVDFALQWLEDYWPQLPQGVNYYAVGEATARHLQHYGLPVSALTASSHGAMNSESLLQVPELQHVANEKIIIFRGCGGRGQLAEVLRTRGAKVTYCELYERKIPQAATEQLRNAFADPAVWHMTQVIACHSGESLQHFLQVLGGLGDKALFERVRQLPILVPGERVAQLARDADFYSILVAENATDAAMTAALQHYQSI